MKTSTIQLILATIIGLVVLVLALILIIGLVRFIIETITDLISCCKQDNYYSVYFRHCNIPKKLIYTGKTKDQVFRSFNKDIQGYTNLKIFRYKGQLQDKDKRYLKEVL